MLFEFIYYNIASTLHNSISDTSGGFDDFSDDARSVLLPGRRLRSDCRTGGVARLATHVHDVESLRHAQSAVSLHDQLFWASAIDGHRRVLGAVLGHWSNDQRTERDAPGVSRLRLGAMDDDHHPRTGFRRPTCFSGVVPLSPGAGLVYIIPASTAKCSM